MADFIIISGDTVIFDMMFEAAIILYPRTTTIAGTGEATYKGKGVCIKGDEEEVKIEGVIYNTSAYGIPGLGTLTIKKLAPDQLADHTKSSKTKMILKGEKFKAEFEVTTEAKSLSLPITLDPKDKYSGEGQFKTNNKHYKGT